MIKLYVIVIFIIVLGIIAYLFSPINIKLHFPLVNKAKDDITSKFGFRTHPVSGEYKFHNGIDIRANEGEYVYAVYDGVVITAGYDNVSGNKVVIKHPGFNSHYAHLKEIFVKEKEKVKKGQVIGTVGRTGLATGYHLHFSISKAGVFLDPLTIARYENFA